MNRKRKRTDSTLKLKRPRNNNNYDCHNNNICNCNSNVYNNNNNNSNICNWNSNVYNNSNINNNSNICNSNNVYKLKNDSDSYNYESENYDNNSDFNDCTTIDSKLVPKTERRYVSKWTEEHLPSEQWLETKKFAATVVDFMRTEHCLERFKDSRQMNFEVQLEKLGEDIVKSLADDGLSSDEFSDKMRKLYYDARMDLRNLTITFMEEQQASRLDDIFPEKYPSEFMFIEKAVSQRLRRCKCKKTEVIENVLMDIKYRNRSKYENKYIINATRRISVFKRDAETQTVSLYKLEPISFL